MLGLQLGLMPLYKKRQVKNGSKKSTFLTSAPPKRKKKKTHTLVSSHSTRQTNVTPDFLWQPHGRPTVAWILYIEIAYTSPCLTKQG